MKKKHASQSGIFNSRIVIAVALCSLGASLGFLSFASTPPRGSSPVGQQTTPPQQANPAAQQALAKIESASQSQMVTQISRQTGNYSFVRAPKSGLLAADKKSDPPQTRALAFLATHGTLVGLNDAERTALGKSSAPAEGSDLQIVKTDTDSIGMTHVKFNQFYRGLQVFGAQLVVHMNDRGITAINGNYVPDISLSTIPALTKAAASENAVAILRKGAGGDDLKVNKAELGIYPIGLVEGNAVVSRLAYAVEVSGAKIHEQVWIDAQAGAVLTRIPLRHTALDRIIYTPQYGEPFDVRHEGDPLTPGPTPGTTGADPINNLYVFAGHTYNLFKSGFGRDAYDGLGHTMHSVLLANDQCPNAYWNGTATNYCPDFDADDVVSHEWGHAYTQYTHNLIYSYQSGALNESYSDISGETADLLNGVDAEGGSNNTQPMPNGQRWQMGEDVNVFNQPVLGILRDMWTPTRFGQPDKVSSGNYSCGASDGGGVHQNSGVPNHAYAMLVDGKTFNGQTVAAIGFNRALAIYYRAMTVYQIPSTDFATHAIALRTSCSDLIGQPINTLSTSSGTSVVSSDVITASTCTQVDKAMLAVEMDNPSPCPVIILLNPNTPPLCTNATDIFAETWETADDGWTRTSTGVTADWEDSSRSQRDFLLDSSLPAGRPGTAIHARNIPIGEDGGGSCQPGGDYSGQFTIDSPNIVIPTGADPLKMRFDHYVATEGGFDGVQVEISVNGAAFALVPQANYEFNAPNTTLDSVIDGNTNPNAGQSAWSGTNINTPSGQPPGSWGTTIIDLSSLTNPGDTIKIRFTASQDGCNGVEGWYVDNIHVYACTTVSNCPPPPFIDDLEPTYQTGWTFETAQNNLPSPTWALATDPNAHTATHSFNSDSSAPDIKDDRLIAPPQNLSATSHLIFWHSFNFEDSYDGGVLEVSTNGGATWADLGGSIVSGGYNGTIDTGFDSPIAGRQAWTFINDDYPMMSRVDVNLGAFAGDNVLVRWRLALDNGVLVPGTGGWNVDDIEFTNLACLIDPPTPTVVVSRKVHGGAGSFDVPLPLVAPYGVECRSNGVTQVVMTFASPVTFTGASMTGTGSVTGTTGNGTSEVTINLSGVTNAQNITVTLLGANAGGASADIPIPIGVLLGDVNASRVVTSGDTNLCKAQALQTVTNANFRNDINASGAITTGDVNIIKQQALTSLD